MQYKIVLPDEIFTHVIHLSATNKKTVLADPSEKTARDSVMENYRITSPQEASFLSLGSLGL